MGHRGAGRIPLPTARCSATREGHRGTLEHVGVGAGVTHDVPAALEGLRGAPPDAEARSPGSSRVPGMADESTWSVRFLSATPWSSLEGECGAARSPVLDGHCGEDRGPEDPSPPGAIASTMPRGSPAARRTPTIRLRPPGVGRRSGGGHLIAGAPSGATPVRARPRGTVGHPLLGRRLDDLLTSAVRPAHSCPWGAWAARLSRKSFRTTFRPFSARWPARVAMARMHCSSSREASALTGSKLLRATRPRMASGSKLI